MRHGLLFGADCLVAEWQKRVYEWDVLFAYERCLGIVDENHNLVGSIFFHGYNKYDLHLSYYGRATLTPGIARAIAQFIIAEFDPARLTVIVSKRNKRLQRSLHRFGFRLEGTQRCYYGREDCNRNTGVRFVAFRDRIDQVARGPRPLNKVA